MLGGALDADEAACALGEQHGVAAALQRHLTRRDQSLAPLLSASLAHACVALPIGRMGNGVVIVCVRDPSPALEAQLARAMKETIKLAVAPAHQLEALVLEAYGPDEANEFDVDLSTGPVMSLELEDEENVEPLSDEALADLGSLELVDLDDTGVSKDESQQQMPIGNQRATTLPPTNVMVDAPTHRPGTAPVVDAPSYRSSTAIVVDAPSQREPPGRAALSAAGIAIPRTQTPRNAPVRETVDDEGIAIPRTQTPMSSGLDAAGPGSAPREQTPPGRAALAAAGPAISRTQTPRSIETEIAVSRTRTPARAEIADELVQARTRTPGRGPIDDELQVSRTRTPGRPSLAAAAARAMESVAAAEAAAIADLQASAAASVAAFELDLDDAPRIEEPAPPSKPMLRPPADPAPSTVASAPPPPAAHAPPPPEMAAAPATSPPKPRFLAAKTLVPPSAVRLPAMAAAPPPVAAAPTPAPKPVTPLPSITPPRAEGLRPPPAALAALQRASSIATRVPAIPPRPIPSALPPRPIAAPAAVARAPEEIAVGTQLPTAALAVSPRLAEAFAALTAAPSVDRICDAVMAFGAKRWSAVVLLDVEGMAATGRRGHGAQVSDDLAQWVVMTLEEPSLLQAAFAFTEVATATPSGHGDVEHRLQQLLGRPRSPSAISISVEGKPLLLLAVGDPDGDDIKTAIADLERLGDATGAALTRLRTR